MASTSFFVVVAFLWASAASGAILYKRELSFHGGSDYHGLNSVHDFGHVPAFKYSPPPAYSTVSFVRTDNSKPVSYSGFTNHGRGHHDPGYAVQFRSEGFQHHHGHHHHHHHY